VPESFTRSPSFLAIIRKPSCLISCSHSSPDGGCGADVGRHGAMKPAGRTRERLACSSFCRFESQHCDINMQLWWRQLACPCRSQMLAPIYEVYERRLPHHVRALPVPRHIGLILDGNRRFGRKNNLSDPDDIYMAGANKLDDLLD
jgi:hypothetical protein